jgi:hypothetical protein
MCDLQLIHHLLCSLKAKLPTNIFTSGAYTQGLKIKTGVSNWENGNWTVLLTGVNELIATPKRKIEEIKAMPASQQDKAIVAHPEAIVAHPEVAATSEEQINPAKIKKLVEIMMFKTEVKQGIAKESTKILTSLQDVYQILSKIPESQITSIDSHERFEHIKQVLISNNIQISEKGLFFGTRMKECGVLISELAHKIELIIKSTNLEKLNTLLKSYEESLQNHEPITKFMDEFEALPPDALAKLGKLGLLFIKYQENFDTLKRSVDYQTSGIHENIMQFFLNLIRTTVSEAYPAFEMVNSIDVLTLKNVAELLNWCNIWDRVKEIKTQIEADKINFLDTHAKLISELESLKLEIDGSRHTSANKKMLLEFLTEQVEKLWTDYAPLTNQLPNNLPVQNKISYLKIIIQAIIDFFHPINALSNKVKKIVDENIAQAELLIELQIFLNLQKSKFAHKFLNAVSKEYQAKFEKLDSLVTKPKVTIEAIAQAVSLEKTVLQNRFSLWAIKQSPENESTPQVSITA